MIDHSEPPNNHDPIGTLAAKIKQIRGDQCDVDLGRQYKILVEKGYFTKTEAIEQLQYHLTRLQENG